MKNPKFYQRDGVPEERIQEVVDRYVDTQPCDVCLVLMPYVSLTHPSLSLGLLKAVLDKTEITSSVVYANLMFGAIIGVEEYHLFDFCNYRRIGDWTFAGAAFPKYAPDIGDALERAARHILTLRGRIKASRDEIIAVADTFRNIRAEAERFIEDLTVAILARKPRVVACSSVFEQHVASLALLRRIKEIAPEVVTVVGGANCQDVMGVATVRSFSWVDVAFSGEAEESVYALCRALMDFGCDVPEDRLPHGAINRAMAERFKRTGSVDVPTAQVEDVDAIPEPDFTEYFQTLSALPIKRKIVPGLLMETSRGCWWRVKKRCTFCGLNGRLGSYRVKSPERAASELKSLVGKYGVNMVEMTDNILDMSYFKTLFPELIRRKAGYRLFYETKANLRREHFKMLSDAGVVWLQPGIESLHDDLLALMEKGVSASLNVQTLKHACEFGIRLSWVLLAAFPGENDNWHFETAAWLPLIYHLQPPSAVVPIFLQRYSTYHEFQDRYRLRLHPVDAYRLSYPVSDEALNELAYYFDNNGQTVGDRMKRPGIQTLNQRVLEWIAATIAEIPPVLSMDDDGDAVDIYDTRPCAPERRVKLNGASACVYRNCDRAIDKTKLLSVILERTSVTYTGEELEEAAASLVERKLLLDLNGRYLSLAVPGAIPEILPKSLFPGGNYQKCDFLCPKTRKEELAIAEPLR